MISGYHFPFIHDEGGTRGEMRDPMAARQYPSRNYNEVVERASVTRPADE